MIRKILPVFVVALVIAGSTTQAGTIKSITATTVGTAFSIDTGLLTMNGHTGIDVQDTSDIITTETGGYFSLSTHLESHASLPGGIASGNFIGGTFEYLDFSNNPMLTGTIVSFNLVEVFDGFGIFAGKGSFNVNPGGMLNASFGATTGSMVDISFSVSPNTISDFDTGFTASSTMTILPIPEPTTIGLLSLGALSLLRRKSVNK
ncbi:MAG: PEP-CTERM sorting domain-containing protein [Planctomycetota bacterium]|nr:PEP-CTERM sorting domain-containing protein [Planctomycetota bacterium]MBU1517737.1 PEP-CTERM sorting domain-containing protein [Planctomycetota bacterium]MBU2457847.1 PEP-CTERM sorting domain-containing protein [Planctomycetota bacterium]MBU2597033.1 PEP-CTERM sorting domain-containing protein [Planctomycetota bacterium]